MNALTLAAARCRTVYGSRLTSVAFSVIKHLFSAPLSRCVAAATVAAIWWHAASLPDPVNAGEAIAADAIRAMPWAIVWMIRLTARSFSQTEEGGES